MSVNIFPCNSQLLHSQDRPRTERSRMNEKRFLRKEGRRAHWRANVKLTKVLRPILLSTNEFGFEKCLPSQLVYLMSLSNRDRGPYRKRMDYVSHPPPIGVLQPRVVAHPIDKPGSMKLSKSVLLEVWKDMVGRHFFPNALQRMQKALNFESSGFAMDNSLLSFYDR